MIVTAGKTNVSVYYYIVGDAGHAAPGEPVTGLLFSDIETGGSASYARQGAARVDLTLITLASASAAHADGGFILVDDTEMPGLYRCDYADATFAAGVDEVSLQIRIASGKNAVAAPIKVQLTVLDLRDGVRAGLTALPNAAADAAGGLSISDAGGLDLDTQLAATNEVTAARMATLTDWINGGRLDLLLDAIPTTAMRGTDGANTTTPPTVAAIADAVWDEAVAGHVGAGSFGKTDADILSDTNELQGDWVNGGRLDLLLDAIPTTAMRGTDSAALASVATEARLVELDAANLPSDIDDIKAVTDILGYEGNAIWIDTVNGAAGTTDYVHGTVDNPVNSIADANTLAASLGISRFEMALNSSITLVAAQANQVFSGDRWTLALGGQNVAGSVFIGAAVSGVMAGTGVLQKFINCVMNATSLIKGTVLTDCLLSATQTVVEAGEFLFDRCSSSVAGTGTVTFNFGAALSSSNLSVRHHSGGWTIENMGAGAGTYNATFEGHGQIVWAASCSATSNASIRGHWKITDNASGAVTETLDDTTVDVNDILVDTNELQADWVDGGRLDVLLDAIPTTAMRGTDSAALASVCTEGRLAELDAGNLPTDIAAIPTTAMRGTDSAALASEVTAARMSELDAGTGGKMANQVDLIKTEADKIALVDAGAGVAGSVIEEVENRATPAQVNTEVDNALDTNISELSQGIPVATPTVRTALIFMYMALRNKFVVQTSGTDALEIYNDAGTLIAKKTITDDGSDYTEAKASSGA